MTTILSLKSGVTILVCTALLSSSSLVSSFNVQKVNHVAFNNRICTSSTFSTQLLAVGSKITMPALSSTMKEGRVVSWLKNEGDPIEAGEAIMVVESDKADMDVEAFEDGILAKILVGEGEMAPVGDAVAIIAESAADVESAIADYHNGGSSSAASAAASSPAVAAAAPGQ